MALTGEYFYRLTNSDMLYSGQKTYNSLSIGLDIETGGHVFTIMFTNSCGLAEADFIPNTRDSWEHGGIKLSFNISRMFKLND